MDQANFKYSYGLFNDGKMCLFDVKECIILIMWEHKIATKDENEPHHILLDC